MSYLQFIGIVCLGGGAGFFWAKLVGCANGSCPLTATPWRGMVFGIILGAMVATSIFSK